MAKEDTTVHFVLDVLHSDELKARADFEAVVAIISRAIKGALLHLDAQHVLTVEPVKGDKVTPVLTAVADANTAETAETAAVA